MSKAKSQTQWHYVLVFTKKGPVFVTGLGEHKTAFWEKNKVPKEFSKDFAESITLGLCLNFTNAVAVSVPYPLEHQPYNYKDYKINFIKKGDTE